MPQAKLFNHSNQDRNSDLAGSQIVVAPSNGIEFDEARNNKNLSIAEVKKIGK